MRKFCKRCNATAITVASVKLVLDDSRLYWWYLPDLMANGLAFIRSYLATASSTRCGHAWDDRFALLDGNEFSQMPIVPLLPPLLSTASLTRLTSGFAMRVIRTWGERGVAGSWLASTFCEGMDLLGEGSNLLPEFLDLRFVAGNEGLDEVTSWLSFGWEFEAMLGPVHPSIWPKNH